MVCASTLPLNFEPVSAWPTLLLPHDCALVLYAVPNALLALDAVCDWVLLLNSEPDA